MSFCKITKKYLPATEMIAVETQEYGKILVDKNVTSVCDVCGEVRLAKELTRIENVYKVYACSQCIDKQEKVVYCSNCNKLFYRYDISYTDNYNNHYCEECTDSLYVSCDYCGELIRRESGWFVDGDVYCNDCYESNTEICTECGDAHNIENMYQDDNGEYYCESCWQDRQNATVHDYCFKPIPNFLDVPPEDTNEYFGLEAEYENEDAYDDDNCVYDAKNFLEIFDDENGKEVYIKHDGSADGFEIVTHPMTRNYIYQIFKEKFEKGLKYLRENDYRGHNKAGIHIHISKEAINPKQLKGMIALLYSKNKTSQNFWLKVSQRQSCELRQWASINRNDLIINKYTKRMLDEGGKPPIGNKRYMAINNLPDNTTEIRLFNSNLRIERVMKNFEVVFSLLDFTATDKLPKVTNYVDFVIKNRDRYKYFADFLEEKHIVEYVKTRQILEQLENEDEQEEREERLCV